MIDQADGARAGPGIADQRRDQMLTPALDVISERGSPTPGIADIAERIGISPALVIYYFKTKDQLLPGPSATTAPRMPRASAGWTGWRPPPSGIEEFVAVICCPVPTQSLGTNSKGLASDFSARQRGTRTWRASGKVGLALAPRHRVARLTGQEDRTFRRYRSTDPFSFSCRPSWTTRRVGLPLMTRSVDRCTCI